MSEFRRHLPHLHPDLGTFFLTWRLCGSVPAAKRESVLYSGRQFVAEDRILDRARRGPLWLADTRIAEIVAYALQAGASERHWYELHAWVVMPNHVHCLLTAREELSSITRWIKGSTARKANLILGRTRQRFWQDESFDHRIRDRSKLHRIVRYIEENPVTAGLVANSEAWHWSSRTGVIPSGSVSAAEPA